MGKGKFITLEGGEGSGKSTQIKTIASFLSQKGISTLITREPGGSPGAELIRHLLVNGKVEKWDSLTEVLLLNAARRDHLVSVIQPALAQGTWVICDRFKDSTLAYQGFGYGVSLKILENLYELIAGSFEPDLTFILDLEARKGLRRALSRKNSEDRYERMDISFHERLRQGYLSLAAQEPSRFIVIDASLSPKAVSQAIQTHLCQRMNL